MEDVGWEDASQVVCVAKCLNSTGRKIPARVVHELRRARTARRAALESQDACSDDSLDDDTSIMELSRKRRRCL